MLLLLFGVPGRTRDAGLRQGCGCPALFRAAAAPAPYPGAAAASRGAPVAGRAPHRTAPSRGAELTARLANGRAARPGTGQWAGRAAGHWPMGGPRGWRAPAPRAVRRRPRVPPARAGLSRSRAGIAAPGGVSSSLSGKACGPGKLKDHGSSLLVFVVNCRCIIRQICSPPG
ncbi:unnamed protein product [Coccothraustes coccothraustes]